VPYAYENKQAEVYFLIINTQGDGSVLPAIKKREQDFIISSISFDDIVDVIESDDK
jgi:hypothetical protein